MALIKRIQDLYTVCLKATDHLNLRNCEYLVGIPQVLRLEFQKFMIFGNFEHTVSFKIGVSKFQNFGNF